MWNHDTLSANSDTNLYGSHPFVLEVRPGSLLLSVVQGALFGHVLFVPTQYTVLARSCTRASASICHCCMYIAALLEGLQCSNAMTYIAALAIINTRLCQMGSKGPASWSMLYCIHLMFVLFLSFLFDACLKGSAVISNNTQLVVIYICTQFKQLPHTVCGRVTCMLQMVAVTASCCSTAMPWKLSSAMIR